MKTLTMCGSIRFEKQMKSIALDLETKYGLNILQCTYNENNTPLSYEEAENIAKAHYKKIDISDGIYIVDIDGYVGKSTKLEIEYAESKGKEIIFNSSFI